MASFELYELRNCHSFAIQFQTEFHPFRRLQIRHSQIIIENFRLYAIILVIQYLFPEFQYSSRNREHITPIKRTLRCNELAKSRIHRLLNGNCDGEVAQRPLWRQPCRVGRGNTCFTTFTPCNLNF